MVSTRSFRWIIPAFALVLLGAFFLPWVQWEKNLLPGYTLPSGQFFRLSSEEYNLGNPYPGMNPLLKLFWLIPVLCIAVLILTVMKKNPNWMGVVAGITALALITVFVLFTKTLLLLGVGSSLIKTLQPGIYVAAIAALVLILASPGIKTWLRLVLMIIGPLGVWIGFMIIEKKIMAEKYDDTATVESAYIVGAQELIGEFKRDEAGANAKYREQILTVSGRITETESPNDSTIIIKMADSTGSFVIFPFTEPYLDKVKKLTPGDSVSIRASCSGGIYSEILETETITFKRCALIHSQ